MATAIAKRPSPPAFSDKELLGLQRYDAMVVAIAECQKVDEVKEIHDKAKALENYYARQAQSFESELRAMDIRIRAAARAGELIAELRKSGGLRPKGKSHVAANDMSKKLEDIGVTRDQSSQWQQLAGVPREQIEKSLPVAIGDRTSIKRIVRDSRPKASPEQIRQQKMASLALRVWGRVRDIPELAENESLRDVVSTMDSQLLDGLLKSLPKAFKFLSELHKEIKRVKSQKGK